ncbi:HNH endonuclease [Anaerolineae bacterium CFX7]|nr:HNH endonuclease [Anaerolineae bacterium CFX7]
MRLSRELRQRIASTARFRCGYCLTTQQVIGPLFEIDHILPRARGGSSDENNLWLACPHCNNEKSDQVEGVDPLTRNVVRLFNPRIDVWNEHFEWQEEGAVIFGKTAMGRVTVAALDMNHPDIVSARRLWVIAGWHPPKEN